MTYVLDSINWRIENVVNISSAPENIYECVVTTWKKTSNIVSLLGSTALAGMCGAVISLLFNFSLGHALVQFVLVLTARTSTYVNRKRLFRTVHTLDKRVI